MKGKFVTFEGSEGSGKSTQSAFLAEYLKVRGYDVLYIREPGGTPISEHIRSILLDQHNAAMGGFCELLLYMAARAQVVRDIIKPALKSGKIVICDRFLDSTIAYQGYGNGVDIGMIKNIGKFATQSIKPDLTIIFDIETEKGLSRTNRVKDRIEQRTLSYHQKVRKGYLELAKKEPKRIRLITVNKSIEEIQAIVKQHIDKLLKI